MVDLWLKSLNFSNKYEVFDVDFSAVDNLRSSENDNENNMKNEESIYTEETFEKRTSVRHKKMSKKMSNFYYFIDNDDNKSKNIHTNSNSDNENKNSTDDKLKINNETIYTKNEKNLLSQYPSKVYFYIISTMLLKKLNMIIVVVF